MRDTLAVYLCKWKMFLHNSIMSSKTDMVNLFNDISGFLLKNFPQLSTYIILYKPSEFNTCPKDTLKYLETKPLTYNTPTQINTIRDELQLHI